MTLHNTLKRVTLQESVNSTNKRGFSYLNIEGLTYMHTRTSQRENESPFKPKPASAGGKQYSVPSQHRPYFLVVCSGLMTGRCSQLPTPPGDPLAALPGVCPGLRSLPHTNFQVRTGRSRKQRAHCLAKTKGIHGVKAAKMPSPSQPQPFLILPTGRKGENKLTQPWHLSTKGSQGIQFKAWPFHFQSIRLNKV